MKKSAKMLEYEIEVYESRLADIERRAAQAHIDEDSELYGMLDELYDRALQDKRVAHEAHREALR